MNKAINVHANDQTSKCSSMIKTVNVHVHATNVHAWSVIRTSRFLCVFFVWLKAVSPQRDRSGWTRDVNLELKVQSLHLKWLPPFSRLEKVDCLPSACKKDDDMGRRSQGRCGPPTTSSMCLVSAGPHTVDIRMEEQIYLRETWLRGHVWQQSWTNKTNAE